MFESGTMELKAAAVLLTTEMAQHGLTEKGWEGKFDEAETRFGICRWREKIISVSRPLVERNSRAEVHDTILHEIAHALAWYETGRNCGHDASWKAICTRIGARPVARYRASEVQGVVGRWLLVHSETGEVFHQYRRRPSRKLAETYIRGRKSETLGKLVILPNPDFAIEHERHRSSEEEQFDSLAPLFGLGCEDYRRSFISEGRIYQLVGFKPRNPKYPIIGRSQTGTLYKFPKDVLSRFWGNRAPGDHISGTDSKEFGTLH